MGGPCGEEQSNGSLAGPAEERISQKRNSTRPCEGGSCREEQTHDSPASLMCGQRHEGIHPAEEQVGRTVVELLPMPRVGGSDGEEQATDSLPGPAEERVGQANRQAETLTVTDQR